MINIKNKIRTFFSCKDCGFTAQKWLGRCPSCYAWNSFEEKKEQPYTVTKKSAASPEVKPLAISDADKPAQKRVNIGIDELDNVLGGGLVRGSVVLIGGPPGIGKSTLMLQAAGKLSAEGAVVYVSGEESAEQVKSRAVRLGVKSTGIALIAENNLEAVLDYLENNRSDCVIVDSIQAVFHPACQSSSGSAAQIRECAQYLVNYAKRKNIPVFILGHVTKEGEIAGPKLLEHLVDAVLYFEVEKQNSTRVLRVHKNRFGPVSEIAIFEMTSSGLIEVKDAAAYFIKNAFGTVPGSCAVCVMEGTKAVFLEVQALLSKVNFGFPKRMVTGYDYNRVALMIALLENKAGLPLSSYDVFVNVVGGVKIEDTGADMGVLVAIASAYLKAVCGGEKLYIGELGLTGETRNVNNVKERLAAAEKYNFKKVYLSAGSEIPPNERKPRLEICKIQSVEQLVESLKS